MKTIILETPGKLTLTETPWPRGLRTDEALVQVRRIGICGTDLHAFRGRQPFFSYPRILGHELGVEVLDVGSEVTHVRPGDACAVEPYLECGRCVACRRGKTNCCVKLEVLGVHIDGGMREWITVPARKLHPSEKLSLDQLALVETLGIGAHAVSRAQIERGEFALVIGAGPIGLSVITFAQAAGARVIVLDTNQQRLDFCRQQYGVEYTLTAGEAALGELRELTNGDLPTLVFDATGSAASMENAFSFVANGGRLVLVGLIQGKVSFSDPEFHRRELTILASRNATGQDFHRILHLIESDTINTTPWITHRADFVDVPTQFPTWINPETGVIKAMVELG